MREPAAIIQPAVDLDLAAKEATVLLAQIRQGEAAIKRVSDQGNKIVDDWRFQLGAILIGVREKWPARGRKAKPWGEFVARLGISMDSAERYIETAKQVKLRPELITSGMRMMDLYRTLGLAEAPPSTARDLPQHEPLAAVNGAARQDLAPRLEHTPYTSPVEEKPAVPAARAKPRQAKREESPAPEVAPPARGPTAFKQTLWPDDSTTDEDQPETAAPPVSGPAPNGGLVADALPAGPCPPAATPPVFDESLALRREVESLREQLAEAVERAEVADRELATLRCALVPSVTRAPSPAQEPTYELDTPGSLDGDLQSIARGIRGVSKMWPFGRKRIGALLRLLINEVDP